MRPLYGILGESLLLFVLVTLLHSTNASGWMAAVFLLVAQILFTFLIHCPAHYIVGGLLGIRFRRMRLGHTTLVRALPPMLRKFASLVPVLSLSVDRTSLEKVGASRRKAMYLSGVVASVSSGFALTAFASSSGNFLAAILTWLYAFAYLASNVLLSPRSGDVMHARIITGR